LPLEQPALQQRRACNLPLTGVASRNSLIVPATASGFACQKLAGLPSRSSAKPSEGWWT